MSSIKKPLPYIWEHAKLSYDRPKRANKYPILEDTKEFVYFENKMDFAYVAVYDNYVVFSFKGTDNVKSWISNLDPYPLKDDEYIKKYLKDGKWGKGTIHDGFYTSWLFFKSCVNKIIESYHLDPNDYDFYTGGHSRGGALAELCSRHLAKNLNIKNSCLTFGAPSVGNKKYRNQFRTLPINGTRVIHGWDIVPTLPPRALGFRPGCANKVWIKKAFWKKWVPWIRVSDHYTSNYNKAIKKRFGKNG